MLGFIPIFLLVGAAIAVVVLKFVPRGIGIAWFVAILFSIAAWIVAIIGKTYLPFSFSDQIWFNLGIENVFPFFQVDLINWPFALSITSIVVGTIIASSARIGLDATHWEWAGILMLGSLGILGSMAGNILTGIFILGLLDLIDIVLQINPFEESKEESISIFVNIFWRLAGLVAFLLAFTWQISLSGSANNWNSIQPGPGYVVLAGCMLRFFIFPSIELIGTSRNSKNGLNVARLTIGFLITSSILFQIPYHIENNVRLAFLLGYVWLVTIYLLYIYSKNNSIIGPPLLLSIAGCLICAEYLYGFSASGIIFTLSIIALIQFMLLKIPVGRLSQSIGFIMLLGLSGLPFTPNDNGLAGFGMVGSFPGFLFLFPLIFLFYSLVRAILEKEDLDNPMREQWAALVSPIGLLFPMVTPWIISLTWLPDAMSFNLSVQGIIVTIGGLALFFGVKTNLIKPYHFNWVSNNQSIYRLAYLTKSFPKKTNVLADIAQQPFVFMLKLFEGDGGILWAILCLVLVVTILQKSRFFLNVT